MVPHIVVEEIWSISSFDDEQRLLRSTTRPLFYGGRQAASVRRGHGDATIIFASALSGGVRP
jgi:hypothetical protein